MLFGVFSKCYENILIILYPEYYECKIIQRINSSSSFIEYEE